jgi:hypothetical protein
VEGAVEAESPPVVEDIRAGVEEADEATHRHKKGKSVSVCFVRTYMLDLAYAGWH